MLQTLYKNDKLHQALSVTVSLKQIEIGDTRHVLNTK